VLCVLQLFLSIHLHAHSDESRIWRDRYFFDYAVIATSLGVFSALHFVEPREPALFGVQYDSQRPSSFLARGHSSVNALYQEKERVPVWAAASFVGLSAGIIGTIEGWSFLNQDKSFHAFRFHASLLAFFESVTSTLALTEMLKVGVGRLRPDFNDRLRRYSCVQEDQQLCQNLGSPIDASTLIDGQKSFLSGHASLSFAAASYAFLAIGGQLVWGKHSRQHGHWRRFLGILLQSTLGLGATYIAASRITDDRHHATDVLAGSALGITMANVFYWQHFNLEGRARGQIHAAQIASGTGLMYSLRW
jgi:membrane-associated phospholipid phosphatase